MAGKNWMKDAVKRPGALRRKARAAGESTSEFAAKHADDPGRTGKQARLAQTFAKFRKGGKGKKAKKKANSGAAQAAALREGAAAP